MKVPFFWPALGLSLGIILGIWFRHLPVQWIVLPAAGLLPILWFARGQKVFLSLFLLLMIFFGTLSTQWSFHRPSNSIENFASSPEENIAEDASPLFANRVSLEGIIQTTPEVQRKGKKVNVSFILSSRNLMRRNQSQERDLGFKRSEFFETNGDVQVFLFNPAMSAPASPNLGKSQFEFQYGERVRIWGALEMPRQVLNPGEFNYGKYLAQRNIYAVMKAFGSQSIKKVGENEAHPFLRLMERIRLKIDSRLDTLFDRHGVEQTRNPYAAQFSAASMFKALLIGRRKGLDASLRDDMMKTGTVHLLAISGLNIGLLVSTFYCLTLWSGAPQKLAAFLSLGLAICYVFIGGAEIPIQRAGWMASVGFVALLLERERNSLNTFFVAFVILLLIEPKSLLNLSFQLSFLSVFSLILFFRDFHEEKQWADFFKSTFAVLIGTFPFVMYYFNIFSPISVMANAGAIPLFHLATLSALLALALGSVPLLGNLVVWMATAFLKAGISWIHLWSLPDWGYFFVTRPTYAQLLSYYFFLSLLIIQQWIPWLKLRVVRILCVSALLTMAVSFFIVRPSEIFSLTLFAAGKNEMAHIQWGAHSNWLINVGRGKPSDQTRWIIDPYLRSKAIKSFSTLVITDFYQKHVGGLTTLLRNFTFNQMIYPFPKDRKKAQKLFEQIPAKINHLHLKPLEKVEFSSDVYFQSLGEVNHQLIFLVAKDGWQFLFLPALDPSILEHLERFRELIASTDIVVLASQRDFSSERIEALIKKMKPIAVTIPHKSLALQKSLEKLDIDLFEIEKHGALTFSVKENDQKGGRLLLDSVRDGGIKEWASEN